MTTENVLVPVFSFGAKFLAKYGGQGDNPVMGHLEYKVVFSEARSQVYDRLDDAIRAIRTEANVQNLTDSQRERYFDTVEVCQVARQPGGDHGSPIPWRNVERQLPQD